LFLSSSSSLRSKNRAIPARRAQLFFSPIRCRSVGDPKIWLGELPRQW
jgi:hypothetical protein